MEYKVECDLDQFDAWSGGKDTLDVLKEKGVCSEVQYFIEELFCDEIPTETAINDVLWFERDFIAQHLGYDDWEAFENGEEEDEEDEILDDEFLDMNGIPIKVGDTVVWYDEAGENEDDSLIHFKVVEDNGQGYFNIAYEGEENPTRWAYCGELEVLE